MNALDFIRLYSGRSLTLRDRESPVVQRLRLGVPVGLGQQSGEVASRRTFGPDHPNVGIVRDNLASFMKDTNRQPKAETT
jgi:hypothetical protein